MASGIMTTDSSIDRQGIRRGKCCSFLCSCSGYCSNEGLLCKKCRHPPTKHENLSTRLGTSKASAFSLLPNRPQSHIKATTVPYYTSSTSPGSLSLQSNISPHHAPSPHHHIPSPHHHTPSPHHHTSPSLTSSLPSYQSSTWPLCKATGCNNRVFHSEGLGYFDYCSPKCRDEHCLPKYNLALDEDIKNGNNKTEVPNPKPSSVATRVVSSPLPSGDDQRYKEVEVELNPTEELGLILEDGKDGSVIIVGMNSPKSVKWLIERKVNLLDSIISVNGEHLCSSKILKFAKPRTILEFLIDQSQVNGHESFYTKLSESNIDKLVCIKKNETLDCGFCINHKCIVDTVFRDSDAKRFGIRKGDKVKLVTGLKDNQLHRVHDILSKTTFDNDMKRMLREFDYVVVGCVLKPYR